MTNLPDTVYYDCSIINNDQSAIKKPPRIVFNDIRSIPILSSPEQYQLSVIRFSLQCANSLPIFIPFIQINNVDDNPNLTTYSITMTYNYDGQIIEGGKYM